MPLTINIEELWDQKYRDSSVPFPIDGSGGGGGGGATTFVAAITADGVTDDTAAWQHAIDAAATAGGGIVIPALSGSSKVTGNGLTISTNQHVFVDGTGVKLLPAVNATCLNVNAAGTGGSAVGGGFAGFVIDGQGRGGTTAVKIRNSERILCSNMNIQNLASGVVILNDGTSSGGPTGNGNGYCEDNHFENLYIASCTVGVDFQSTNGSNVSLEENTFHHVGISGCTTGIRQAAGLEFRAIVMAGVKIWVTAPGGQTAIELNGDIVDWVAQIHFESLNAQANQTGVHFSSTGTNPDQAHLDFGWLGTWTNKFVVDSPQTLGIAYNSGRDRFLGGKAGGYPIRLLRDTDTHPRMRFTVSPTGFELGGGGGSDPDVVIQRRASGALDGVLTVNRFISATDGVTAKVVTGKPLDSQYAGGQVPDNGALVLDNTAASLSAGPQLMVRTGTNAYTQAHGLIGYRRCEPSYVLNGKQSVSETMRRLEARDTVTLTDGQLRLVPCVIEFGQVITTASFLSVGALTAGTSFHFWAAVYDQDLTLAYSSADLTSQTWAANTPLDVPLTLDKNGSAQASFTFGTAGACWVGLMIVAGGGGTLPTLRGVNAAHLSVSQAIVANQLPLAITGGSSLSTLPPPSTVTLGTANTGIFYAAVH